MGKYDIAIEDWYVLRDEAIEYLNRVAGEMRIRGSFDPMLSRLHPLTNFVDVKLGLGRVVIYTFQFEMDRGRPFKGHYYEVRVTDGTCTDMWRVGNWETGRLRFDETGEPLALSDLTGQRLLDLIRLYMVYDVSVA